MASAAVAAKPQAPRRASVLKSIWSSSAANMASAVSSTTRASPMQRISVLKTLAESVHCGASLGSDHGEPTMSRTCLTIVLAAGEGTRMHASRPKVLHAIAGRTLLAHVLGTVSEIAGSAAVVVGPGQDQVAAEVAR